MASVGIRLILVLVGDGSLYAFRIRCGILDPHSARASSPSQLDAATAVSSHGSSGDLLSWQRCPAVYTIVDWVVSTCPGNFVHDVGNG